MTYRITDLPARIAAKIEPSPDGCWLWVASLNWGGYGNLWWDGQMLKAHRVVYQLLVGPVPDGLQTDHLCRVRHCVNPSHIEPVTPVENVMRGESFGATNARVTHCPRGHPYDSENTYTNPFGGRECQPCRRKRQAAWEQKRRLAALRDRDRP